MKCKRLKLAGIMLAVAFARMAYAEAGSSCIITPGTPATWASVNFGNAIEPFDSCAVLTAMCEPTEFNPFDSRVSTSAFAELSRFRSDAPVGFRIIFK